MSTTSAKLVTLITEKWYHENKGAGNPMHTVPWRWQPLFVDVSDYRSWGQQGQVQVKSLAIHAPWHLVDLFHGCNCTWPPSQICGGALNNYSVVGNGQSSINGQLLTILIHPWSWFRNEKLVLQQQPSGHNCRIIDFSLASAHCSALISAHPSWSWVKRTKWFESSILFKAVHLNPNTMEGKKHEK